MLHGSERRHARAPFHCAVLVATRLANVLSDALVITAVTRMQAPVATKGDQK